MIRTGGGGGDRACGLWISRRPECVGLALGCLATVWCHDSTSQQARIWSRSLATALFQSGSADCGRLCDSSTHCSIYNGACSILLRYHPAGLCSSSLLFQEQHPTDAVRQPCCFTVSSVVVPYPLVDLLEDLHPSVSHRMGKLRREQSSSRIHQQSQEEEPPSSAKL
jgi:hypothetical protein